MHSSAFLDICGNTVVLLGLVYLVDMEMVSRDLCCMGLGGVEHWDGMAGFV